MRPARGKVAKCSPVFAGCTAATMSAFVNIRGASDRAAFTARRKEAYEALHPETAHGRNTKESGQVGHPSFSDDQAEKTGQSARGVRRDAERGEKVCDDALRLVRGTRLDTGAFLDRIKNLAPEQQVARVQAELRGAERQSAEARKASKIDGDVKSRAATEVAEVG